MAAQCIVGEPLGQGNREAVAHTRLAQGTGTAAFPAAAGNNRLVLSPSGNRKSRGSNR